MAHAGMEWRVADDGSVTPVHLAQAIGGIHLALHPVALQTLRCAIQRQRINIHQFELALRIAPRQYRGQYPCAATEIQHLAGRQRRQFIQQQLTTFIQPAMAEHTRQAGQLDLLIGEAQRNGFLPILQIEGGNLITNPGTPELAVAGRVELFRRIAQLAQQLFRPGNAALLLSHQVQRTAGPEQRGDLCQCILCPLDGFGHHQNDSIQLRHPWTQMGKNKLVLGQLVTQPQVRRVIPGPDMPVGGQFTRQLISRGVDQQQALASKQFDTALKNLTGIIHGKTLCR